VEVFEGFKIAHSYSASTHYRKRMSNVLCLDRNVRTADMLYNIGDSSQVLVSGLESDACYGYLL
jgi:hypothetical protein